MSLASYQTAPPRVEWLALCIIEKILARAAIFRKILGLWLIKKQEDLPVTAETVTLNTEA